MFVFIFTYFHDISVDYMSGKLMSYDATCRINREHISNSEKNMKLFHALQSRMQALKQQNQDIIVSEYIYIYVINAGLKIQYLI